MDKFRQAQRKHLGKGGWHCYCCGPDNAEEKRTLRRIARRKLRRELREKVSDAS